MPRKRINRPLPDRKRSEVDEDDFFFDDTQSSSGRTSHEPLHRNAANARERARMRVLAKAFCRLKTTLPWVPADTKLSKLDTLRLAASYIAHLRALLHEPRSAHTPPHPLSLAWPFAFQHGGAHSCSISQRWSVNPHQNEASDQSPRDLREQHNDNFAQEYETEYEERSYEDMAANEPCTQYGYKEYYELRNNNNYSTENMIG